MYQKSNADLDYKIPLEIKLMDQKKFENNTDTPQGEFGGEFGDELISLPEGVDLPPSVTLFLISYRLHKMLF